MEVRIAAWIAVLVISGCLNAKAADTAIGPIDKTCQEVNLADRETKKLILVWLYGYASGVNYQTQQDFLRGRDGTAFLEYLTASCEFNPDKRMLTVAREIVRRLIADTTRR
nr:MULTISPECIES: HdeA/HdeB family chaperone [unclassified Bradyrhizobium]